MNANVIAELPFGARQAVVESRRGVGVAGRRLAGKHDRPLAERVAVFDPVASRDVQSRIAVWQSDGAQHAERERHQETPGSARGRTAISTGSILR